MQSRQYRPSGLDSRSCTRSRDGIFLVQISDFARELDLVERLGCRESDLYRAERPPYTTIVLPGQLASCRRQSSGV